MWGKFQATTAEMFDATARRGGHLAVPLLVALLAAALLAAPATSARQAGTPAATTGDDPCAAIIAAGTPAAEHGATAPDALDPVPAEQTGALGNPADYPFDLIFIDAMIAHHEGAIILAEIALIRAEHEELRELARAIVETQRAEIDQLVAWRTAWYGEADPVPANVTIGLMDEGMMQSGASADAGLGMGGPVVDTASDAYRLCTATGSFDLAFIALMIPHHQGAIGMALLAQQRAEHAELLDLAAAIIQAQEAEVTQMSTWQATWAAEAATPAA